MSVSATAGGGWAMAELPHATSPAARVAVAVGAAVGVDIGVRLLLDPLLPHDQVAYLLAALAVLVSASVAGVWAGGLTTLLLALASSFLWVAPYHSFGIDRWQDQLQMGLFLAVGLSISALAGREAEAKRQARRSEERFRRMFEQGPLGITIVDREYRLLGVNRMFCRMLGYADHELVGRTIESLTYPEDVAEDGVLSGQMWDGRTTGYTRTKRYVRKDGTVFWAAVSVAVMRDGGGRPTFALGMIQDITDRKQMEESLERARAEAEVAREAAEAAGRAKDHFLAVLSHELRTPLSPVLLVASSLEADTGLPGAVREDVHTIRQNVELEARLIDDLLDLTGITRGKLSLHRTRVDVHGLIGEALYMVERDVEEKGLRVRVGLDAPRAEVDGDPARLEQVFWNLVKNAVKFTPAGGEVSVRTRNEGGGWLVAEVRDTGIGIAPEALPRLFRPFEQVSPGVTRQFGGLGLGLAIAGSIVEMHGGWIRATSEGLGRGATFTVGIPLAPGGVAGEGRPVVDGTRPATPPRAAAPMRVLLVEDHPATRRAMASIVRSMGHEVRAAGTVAEALAMAEEGAFDLLISDLALPDGSGHDLMRQLRKKRPVRGVAVSGFGMEEDVRRSREAGFESHLTKPVSRERIQEVLGGLRG